MYDFSGETATFPMDAESVSWFQVAQNTVQSNTAYRNIDAVREQQTSDGAYFRSEQMFLFPQGQAGQQFLYMPGDTITDSNDNLYTVLSSGGGFAGSAFQINCRLLGIQDFGHTTKYIRVSSASAGNTARIISEAAGSAVLSAIQPQENVVTDEFGTIATPQSYKIWRATPINQESINAGDMFEDEAGVRYEIIAVGDRRRIDELTVYDCIKKL